MACHNRLVIDNGKVINGLCLTLYIVENVGINVRTQLVVGQTDVVVCWPGKLIKFYWWMYPEGTIYFASSSLLDEDRYIEENVTN